MVEAFHYIEGPESKTDVCIKLPSIEKPIIDTIGTQETGFFSAAISHDFSISCSLESLFLKK